MKLLSAAILPVLYILTAAPDLLSQDFDDYVFAQERFYRTPDNKSQHSWHVVRMRCERLAQESPENWRAALTILEFRSTERGGFGLCDSAVPFGYQHPSYFHSAAGSAIGRDIILRNSLIGERILLTVKNGEPMTVTAASEEKPANAPATWTSPKVRTFMSNYRIETALMIPAIVRSDLATLTRRLEEASHPMIGKGAIERTDYGHCVHFVGPVEGTHVRQDLHYADAGVLLGSEMTTTNRPEFPIADAMRGDLPIPTAYERVHHTLRRIEANGLPWQTKGVFESLVPPGLADVPGVALRIVDPTGPLKDVLVGGKSPIVIHAHTVESMKQLRARLHSCADPRQFPDTTVDRIGGPVGPTWPSGAPIYPSSQPLQITCDPGMPTAWVQGVLQICTFIPGESQRAALAQSPLIWKTRWRLGGTDLVVPMPLPTDKQLDAATLAPTVTFNVAPKKATTGKQAWDLRVAGASSELQGTINGWTIKPDRSGVALTTQPADLMSRLKALATAAKKANGDTSLALRLDPKTPFALSFAVAARLSGLATADNPITIHGAPADLVKQLDAGTFNR